MERSNGTMTIKGREYPVPERFTLGESRLIKQISGVRLGEIMDALSAGDPDLLAALAVIVTKRAGRPITLEQLDDIEITDFDFTEPNEGDAGPPPAATAAEDGSSATTPSSSGPPSSETSSA